jgi:hypothetical protein
MSIPAVVKSLDEVRAEWRKYYRPAGGVFAIIVDGLDDHPAVRALKAAHEKSKASLRAAKAAIAALEREEQAFTATMRERRRELAEKIASEDP